ncbi:MAG: efflux RND transporter periplasmic adaptor subunit [Bacteroidota bacterium]|nr:efflux RND transporter periplasmic adaptor subunit [Bacteroidota bacterium]
MAEKENIDLSKLKIKREEEPRTIDGSRKRRGIFFYIAGALVLLIPAFFFLKGLFTTTEVVALTTVSYISPNQASALLTASGYVVAQRKASIASKATGRLVYLGYEEGDRVKKGDIIARIESADVEAALNQAKASFEVSKADRNDAEQSLERARKLFEGKLISKAELDAAQARYDRVIATISAANAAIKAAEVQLENTIIRAPFDGTILTKNADVGEVVAPFAAGVSSRVAVVTIADMSSLEVEADVSESNIERISENQPCEISLDAYPDKRYRGVVNKIVPTADRAKATVLTKIRFLEKDSRVLPEMSAKVNFLQNISTDSIDVQPILAVDSDAIVKLNDEKIVFVFKENKVVGTLVITGKSFGRFVEIKSGLSQGDKVVLKPSKDLRTGSSVKMK